MKPFLSYGWQPQVMAVERRHKAIFAGRIELYDVGADPGETRDLGVGSAAAGMRNALDDYPLPSREQRRAAAPHRGGAANLASLGYVSGRRTPVVRRTRRGPST